MLALAAAAVMALMAAAGARAQPAPIRLNGLAGDHAVLQRGKPIEVQGVAAPGARIAVEFAGDTAAAVADGTGAWTAALPARPAGGPYDLTAREGSGEARRVADVLVGDVFLCSGQSNMEFDLKSAASGARAVDGSADPQLRLATVDHASVPVPQPGLRSRALWRTASPAETAGFSAVCYHFGRELRRRAGVPIGLVQATWSGSLIESWIGPDAFRRLGGHDEDLALNGLFASDPSRAGAEVGRRWQAWWVPASPPGAQPWRGDPGLDWKPVPLPWRNWTLWGAPDLSANEALVWFRREVDLTAEQAAQPSRLKLGELHEQTQVWINGVPVAASFDWGTEGDFALPAGTFRAGANTIVAGVFSSYDPGGLLGPAEHMTLAFNTGAALPLGAGWTYAHPPAPSGRPPLAPWFFYGGSTNLYNAMIAPLQAVRPRGVLWYQGESNTGRPDLYAGKLGALERSWRDLFGERTPFLIVQLPNFGAPSGAPADSDWAALREAQRRAVDADPASALVTTIDLGLDNDLHPPNKQPVGARAARAAGALIYGEPVSASGPKPAGAVHDRDAVVVAFAAAGPGLVAYSAGAPTAFELCGPARGSCRFAPARIEGDKVRIESASAPAATRVRYCWGDAPRCNLYDGSGLPVGPFEAEIR